MHNNIQMTPTSHDEAGFTLLEILVALGILAMSLTVLIATFTTALDRTRESDNRRGAQDLAQALLLRAEASDPAELKNKTGHAAQHYDWELTIAPYGAPAERDAWRQSAIRLTVRVTWDDHGRTRAVFLSTLRLMSREAHD